MIIYAIDNFINSQTPLFASSEDAIYELENAYNIRPSLPFRWRGDRETPRNDPEWICVDLGRRRFVTFCAIFNHNFNADFSATDLALKACDQPCPPISGFCNWASLPSGACEEDLLSRIVANHRNLYKKIECVPKYQYWRLENSVLNQPIPQIGEWFLGEWESFSIDINLQPQPGEGPDFSLTRNVTAYNQGWQSFNSEIEYTASLTFFSLEDPQVFEIFHRFLRRVMENDGKFVFVPEDSEKFVYYCEITNVAQAQSIVHGDCGKLKSWTLEMRSLTEGITLL